MYKENLIQTWKRRVWIVTWQKFADIKVDFKRIFVYLPNILTLGLVHTELKRRRK